MQEVVIADAIKGESVVNVVQDHPGIGIVGDDVGERSNFSPAVNHAGWIRWIVEQEHLRLGRDRRVELRRLELVVLLRRTRQQQWLGTDDLGEVKIGGPIRRCKGDCVAFVEECFGKVVEYMLGADAKRHVAPRVAGHAVFFQVLDGRIQQRFAAAIGTVLAGIVTQRLCCRCIDVLAGQEVGDTNGKTDDVAAGCLELFRLVGDGHDGAGLGATDARGETGHDYLK